MPRINVTRSSMPPIGEYFAEVAPLWESRWITNAGERHRELEAALEKRLGVADVCLFVNGHSALECAIEALELGSDGRDEVVTTPFTFASTTHAIVRKGLKPVFADVRESDLTIDPDLLERAITPRTCAILPVHVYGNLCDVGAIREVADRHGLKVIYDAAHAFGVERWDPAAGKWEGVATYGDASMLSFHATKVFNTIEGGAVCFGDPALRGALERWRNFGIVDPESVECVGGNAKMDEFRAAMGLCNLRHFDEEVAKRKDVAERYWSNLEGIAGAAALRPGEGVRPNYAYMPVLFDAEAFGSTRDEVFAVLAAEGFVARKYFYPLVSDYACYRDSYSSESTPIAKCAAERVLCLPMYADLALGDVDEVCRVIRGCAR
ncbi:aminotransferase [Gordonibacter sp. An230]|uniref:DegT/DnrJ/EryC1/StrS family aminotransferase n=1 Tax=Gordonibacter sp. An230 TaxID=1965592 RepID=UPI000B388E4E|nr:DegT/DnrJ/EryC1/StrS family aminotransferase [Gordonibacter sp. An230]OUO91804.1 aminotransferase [Gordonibacter sp. An230]